MDNYYIGQLLFDNLSMQQQHHEEEGFFALVERVGSCGRYQKQTLLLFYLIWFVTAFLILSSPFLLMPARYTCPPQVPANHCRQYICELPQQQRNQFRSPIVESLTSRFKEYDCVAGLADFKLPLFLGIFAGYLCFSYYSDNFGRRRAMLLTWTTALAGLTLLCFAESPRWAALGLFLAGAGCESNLRVNLAVINEIVDYHLRQAYSIILQSAFGAAGLATAAAYYFLRDWWTATLLCCLLPAVVVLVWVAMRLEQTPSHLSAMGTEAVLASLRRIAAINGLQCSVREEDVGRARAVRLEGQRLRQTARGFTLFDLFRYPSLKRKTLYLLLMLFCIASLYLGPNAAIESLGGDVFAVQVLLSLPDCIVYALTYRSIHLIERRKAGLQSLGIACVCLLACLPLGGAVEGAGLWGRLGLLFLSRCCVSFYYGILFLYIIELYPEQVRSIGFGTVSAGGALGGIAVQKVASLAEQWDHDPLAYLLIFSFLCLVAAFHLPQTHGNPLQVEIEELRTKRKSQRYEPTLEESYTDLPELPEESERKTSVSQATSDK